MQNHKRKYFEIGVFKMKYPYEVMEISKKLVNCGILNNKIDLKI